MGAPRQEAKPAPTDAETVMGYIAQKQENACLYKALAPRVCSRCRNLLLEMANEELCAMKELAAVYFVMTGRKACPAPSPKPCITCAAETLRQQYGEVLTSAGQYEAMASGEFCHIFHSLAQTARAERGFKPPAAQLRGPQDTGL